MEEIIQKGRNNAEAVLNQVANQIPKDLVVPAKALTVVPQEGFGKFKLRIRNGEPYNVHDHARTQICDKTGMPNTYINKLMDRYGKAQKTDDKDPWAQELLTHNLNQLLLHSDDRHLVRAIGKNRDAEIRGFLSDRYRRLDSRPLLDAFMGACTKIGALPIEGYALDTRVRMRAVLPYVFEPVENEVMLFGAEWKNSDFGNGGHGLSLFTVRVWCTNTAIADEVLRQVHLGKRLDDNIEYSRKTLELDTKTNASAVADLVWNMLEPKRIEEYMTHIRTAAEDKIDDKDITRILKTKLSKSELENVTDLFDGPDVVNLPAGKTTYRLANALTFFAQNDKISRDRQLDLQELAGAMVPLSNGKAKEV